MTKKKNIKIEKLTENICYRIIDSTIYLLLSSNDISKEELNIAYKKISLIIEDNELSYINISGKQLEKNKTYFMDLGFTLSYYDVDKLNELYAGVKEKKSYRCYGIMTKKDFYSKINKEKIEVKPKRENIKVTSSNSGYVSNLLLLFGGIALLCYFCIQGAIYLVR